MIDWARYSHLRSALFLGFNGLVLALGLALCVPINAFFADRDAEIAQQRALLARFTAIAAQEQTVRTVARETDAQLDLGEFLKGANENAISAELQTRLKGMTESTGAKLRSIQALPAQTMDKIKYIGSRMVFSGSLQSVQRAIHAIESSKPYLFVSSAAIKPAQGVSRPGVAEEPSLEVRLDVFGVLSAGTKS